MPGKNIRIHSSAGGEFDCYLALPGSGGKVPAASDLFWRSIPGPLPLAPPEVLNAYRALPPRMKNVEVHVFPGILHGYMMRGNAKAFHPATRDFSMSRAVAILDGLSGA